MNNKAFGNLFCNSQKSFHTSPGSSDSNNRGYRSFFKHNNGICIYKKILDVKFFVNAIVEFGDWSIASIIRVIRSRGGVKPFCELQNKLPKALRFNEANYERIELTHCVGIKVAQKHSFVAFH